MKSLKGGKSSETRETGAEKWSSSCLLISDKRPNNLTGDLEVTFANEKLYRKVVSFSFHIHTYPSKRCISRLWFCQHETIFMEKCVHLLAVSYWVYHVRVHILKKEKVRSKHWIMTSLFTEVIMRFSWSGTATETLGISKKAQNCVQNHCITIPSTFTLLLTNQLGLEGKYFDYQNEFFLMGSNAECLQVLYYWGKDLALWVYQTCFIHVILFPLQFDNTVSTACTCSKISVLFLMFTSTGSMF